MLVLSLFVVLAVVLTGCPAQPAASTPAATAKPAATPAAVATTAAATPAAAATKPAATPAAAAPAKIITVTMTQEPDTLFPFIGSMMASTQVKFALFEQCIMLNEKNEYVAWACETMPTVENGGAKFVGEAADRHLEVTFKWKQGLKWHDGTPVTSKDVAFTHKLMLNPEFPADQRDWALRIAEVKAVDDRTFTLVFHSEKTAKQAGASGWAGLQNKDLYEGYGEQVGPVLDPRYFALADMGEIILPEHVLGKVAPKDMKTHEFNRKPLGNGAYKLKEWVPAQTVAIEAADNGIRKPVTQTIVFKIVADATAALNAMAAGEVQAAVNPAFDLDQVPELDKLAADKKIIPFYSPSAAWEHIDFNLLNPLLADKAVRKAIAYGIDRKSLVDKVLYGKSVVLHTWFAAAPWANDDAAVVKYDYNPQKAKDTLAAAGYKLGSDGIMEKDGKKLRFKFQTTNAKLRMQVGPIVQANLKEIGIQIDPEYIPGRGLFEKEGPLATSTFELGLYTWVSDPDPDPNNLYLSKNCVKDTGGVNYPCWKNAEFDKLGLQQISELDRTKRKAILSQMQKIWTDELPSLPLFQRIQVTAANPKLQNFKASLSNTPETFNAFEWSFPAQ
jgi:peptide/nickel transport system substrate-binding protein